MKKMLIIMMIIAWSVNAFGWDNEKIHPLITKYAADRFFDLDFLQKELVLDAETLTVEKWLQEGSKREDAGTASQFALGIARSLNHFHSPTTTNPTKKTLETSGLSDRASGESALLWTQDGNNQALKVGGNWSWKMVRDHQYNYLTLTRGADKDANLARLLMGLGYQMHMIQDMSQPNHVRNNTHIMDGLGYGGFETWAKANVSIIKQQILDVYPIPTVTVDLTGKFNEKPDLAPVAKLFDTRTYMGTNTPTVSLSQGLSEYTNGNFFSQDTIFSAEQYANDHSNKYYFPYPRKEATDIQSYIDRKKAAQGGIYISKTGEGENLTYLATEGVSTRWIQSLLGTGKWFYGSFKLDEKCYQEYAQKLIPRSVAYSKALLDYFYRGKLEISPPAQQVYSIIDGSIIPQQFTTIRAKVKNTTPNEAITAGSLVAVARYKIDPNYAAAVTGRIAENGTNSPAIINFNGNNFTMEHLPLEEGGNTITVTARDASGQTFTATRIYGF